MKDENKKKNGVAEGLWRVLMFPLGSAVCGKIKVQTIAAQKYTTSQAA